MDLRKSGFENLEEDIINKIYRNNMEELQYINQTKEYIEVTKKIKKMEKMLFKEFTKENVTRYIEYINEKVSIEAENQFELGFKTAIKIILQALK